MPLVQKGMAMMSNRAPKIISPRAHAIIDYAVAATFFTMGALFWKRNKRAAISAFVCGGATATTSLLTAYPGGVWKEISFETHGRIDLGLAGLTATLPNLMDFNDEHEARFFQMQGIAETAVAVLTDFDALEHTGYDRETHAA